MNNKLSFRDYLFYVYSGFFWIAIIVYCSFESEMIDMATIKKINEIDNMVLYLPVSIFLLSYFIGHVARFANPLKKISEILWGLPTYAALYEDEINPEFMEWEKAGLISLFKNKKAWVYKKIFKKIDKKLRKRRTPLDDYYSKIIIQNLKKLGILHPTEKGTQFVMASTYLDLYYKDLAYYRYRYRDLKGFYSSVFLPYVLILGIFTYEFVQLEISAYIKILFLFLMIHLIYRFIFRYFSFRKILIEEVYESFFFIPNVKENTSETSLCHPKINEEE